jgi:Cytochrome P460
LLDPVMSRLCAAQDTGVGDPHAKKYISVYVNDIGRTAMMSEKSPRFPQGSIIVKAKSSGEAADVPELVTIMVKRAEGYDRENGNWEYLVMNGDGSRLEKPANVESCRRCHFVHRGTDFVSRVYLPASVREKLR